MRPQPSSIEKEYDLLRGDVVAILNNWLDGHVSRKNNLPLHSWTLQDKAWKNLFASLASVSLEEVNVRTQTRTGEWNPLSQQIAMPNSWLEAPLLAEGFIKLQYTFTLAILMNHEALHIAFWEPFFSGQLKVKDRAEFVYASLLFEGAGFYDADIVRTEKIRKKFKNVEPLFSRTAVSQNTFHPRFAFKELNITNNREILKIYLDGFTGDNIPTKKKIVSSSFTQRIVDFYHASTPTLEKMWDLMSGSGVFSEFQERFCPPTTPRLFNYSAKNLYQYSLNYQKLVLQPIARATPRTIELVRRRRIIQQRAYFALQTRFLLERKLIAPLPDIKKIKAEVELYLAHLEAILSTLEKRTFWADMKKIDQTWDLKIGKQFTKNKSIVLERHFIYPTQAVSHISLRPGQKITAKNRLRIWNLLNQRLSVSKKVNPQKIKLICDFLHSKEMQSYKLLMNPNISDLWAVSADSISPKNNTFRDLLYLYE